MRCVNQRQSGPLFHLQLHGRTGFTLVELLVSTAVLVLLMAMTSQMVSHTMSATTASNKRMDTASMARIALDRLSFDFSSAILNGGVTALYYSGSTGTTIDTDKNSALAFICKSRARRTTTAQAVRDIRGMVAGFKIRDQDTLVAPGNTSKIPLLARGDAEFTYSVAYTGAGQEAKNYQWNIWEMFSASGAYSLPTGLMSGDTGADQYLLDWQGLGDGILRFHVSFVLDDGTTVQIPPSQNDLSANPKIINFPTNGANLTGDCIPIAFSANTSTAAGYRYVTGLIVGVAVLDEATLRLAYVQDPNYATTLASQLKRPTAINETPYQIWQANLPKVTYQPVQQAIRFYQRFIPVNL